MKQTVVATFFGKTIISALSIWYRALFGIVWTKPHSYVNLHLGFLDAAVEANAFHLRDYIHSESSWHLSEKSESTESCVFFTGTPVSSHKVDSLGWE
jgi:hypothetical protein